VTEQEAKILQCCRDVGEACAGSRCMGWRWSQAKDTEAFLAAVRERMKSTNENFAKATQAALLEHRDTYERTEGYCGLAGAIS
jgi:hypothetical protein